MTAPAGSLVALFVAALALRPQILAAGPLLPSIQDDLGVSHTVGGLLGTIPVLCMGVFAPAAALLAGRFGARLVIGSAVVLIAAGGLLRVATADAAVLIAFTLPVGIGIAIGGTLMPMAVKERLAHRPAFGTGIYATGIQLGSAVAAALAVPLAHVYGGWRFSLAVFSVAAALSAFAWLALTRDAPARPTAMIRPPRLPVRSAMAWGLAGVFALVGISFYGLSAWFPNAYVEHGWSEGRAGALLAVLQAATVVAGLAVPWLADRAGSRRLYLISAAALQTGALVGVLLAPGAGWLWAVLIGLGMGALFPIVMTLPLDLSQGPAQAGAVAGLMLGAGYTAIALSPVVLGAVRDATGSFSASLWLIVGVGVCLTAASLALSRERLRRHVLAEPARP